MPRLQTAATPKHVTALSIPFPILSQLAPRLGIRKPVNMDVADEMTRMHICQYDHTAVFDSVHAENGECDVLYLVRSVLCCAVLCAVLML